MRIVELRADNFKRLRAVRIEPTGALVQITGRNAQGKSSVLDAVWAALGGKGASPEAPIRDGETEAKVYIDLGDLRVTRRFIGERSTLVVESPDGARYSSPQAVLDALVGRLTFDPLAFSRLPPREQARTLREVLGIDTAGLDDERARLFERRTLVNREARRLAAQVEAMRVVDAPTDEVSIAVLATEYAAATKKSAELDRERDRWQKAIENQKQIAIKIASLHNQIAVLEEQLAASKAEADITAEAIAVAEFDLPDISEIADRMRSAERVNAAVRARRERETKVAQLAKEEQVAASLTDEIVKIDQRKSALLGAVKFPVPGLSVSGDAVTLNGVPFAQSSSAEQLRVGLAIGAALNPKLRVVLVRDGSLLDDDGLRIVAEWAEANDMQVILERVADGSNIGIVIEDGEVVQPEKVTRAVTR